MLGYEVSLKKSVSVQNVQQAEGESCISSRKRLEVEVGLGRGLRPDWINNDLLGWRVRQPMLVRMWGGMGRVCAPDQNTARVRGSAGVKADGRTAEQQPPGNMSGHIADRVRLDFGCTQAVKETQGKHIGQQRQRAGVMGMNDGFRAGRLHNVPEFRGNG